MSRGRTPLALLATLALLAGPSAAGAKPRPRPHVAVRPVSAVPYRAPWRSDFERFSTQELQLKANGTQQRDITSPQGQWWRIISLFEGMSTSAVAGNRALRLFVSTTPATGLTYLIGTPATIIASDSLRATWGPGLTAFGNTAILNNGFAVAGIPDMLLPPGSTISVVMTGAQAGDAFTTDNALAVEVYVPIKDAPGVLVPLPKPV